MVTKARLWKQAQEARAQAREARLARLDLLGRNDEKAQELARTAADHERRAQEFVDELEALTDRPSVEIDWGDLTNYS